METLDSETTHDNPGINSGRPIALAAIARCEPNVKHRRLAAVVRSFKYVMKASDYIYGMGSHT
jgi:hypothetical protein